MSTNQTLEQAWIECNKEAWVIMNTKPHIKKENGAWHCRAPGKEISFGATSPFLAYCNWELNNFKSASVSLLSLR